MARNNSQWTSRPALPDTHFVSGAVYSDPALYEDEKRLILNKVWHFAAHESELPQRSDYRTFQHAGLPLFVVRGSDNRIRCFINACSHRGAKILNEVSGNAEHITCFYHKWSYSDRGACIDIPRKTGFDAVGLDKATYGLRELRCETRSGLVFVNLDDAAPPLAEFVGSALGIFDEVFDKGVEYEVFHFHRATIDANWKAWQETIVDLYHEFMHVVLRTTQMTAAPMAARQMRAYTNGHQSIGGIKANYDGYKGYGERKANLAFPGLTVDDARFTTLFPDTAIITRGTVMRIDTVTPLGPHKTLVESRGLGIRGESEADRLERINHHNDYWGPFGRNVPEDAFAAEACEKTFGPAAARYQIIARQEDGGGQDDLMLRAYYAEWARMMGRSPSNPVNGSNGG